MAPTSGPKNLALTAAQAWRTRLFAEAVLLSVFQAVRLLRLFYPTAVGGGLFSVAAIGDGALWRAAFALVSRRANSTRWG